MMTDADRETKVREALHQGCVQDARQWADSIGDVRLRQAMQQLVREYERG